MMKVYKILIIAVFVLSISLPCFAQKNAADILKAGLLGAGAGAVGGIASGGSGSDAWKGALAGAGINIVGGALLDTIGGGSVNSTQRTQVVQAPMQPQDAYSQAYKEGFNVGYKQGYTQGYKDCLKDNNFK